MKLICLNYLDKMMRPFADLCINKQLAGMRGFLLLFSLVYCLVIKGIIEHKRFPINFKLGNIHTIALTIQFEFPNKNTSNELPT